MALILFVLTSKFQLLIYRIGRQLQCKNVLKWKNEIDLYLLTIGDTVVKLLGKFYNVVLLSPLWPYRFNY